MIFLSKADGRKLIEVIVSDEFEEGILVIFYLHAVDFFLSHQNVFTIFFDDSGVAFDNKSFGIERSSLIIE